VTTSAAIALSAADARRVRLGSLLLDGVADRTPAEVVTWFGAMQAQDLASGHWSFGVRIPGSTADAVEAATEAREIVRGWPMRGTIHYVPPRDLAWMLEVTGVRALAEAGRRREQIGLSAADADRAAELLGEALAGGRRLTRSACVALLADAGLATASQHGYHLLWYASQQGVTCIGPQEGKEQTFVRLDDWVPDPVRLDRDEALAELARRFVRSHGPASVKDLAGWTGLTMGDARAGVAAIGDEVVEATVDGAAQLIAADALDRAPAAGGAAWLLPGFDELVLGYKDRSLLGPPDLLDRIVPGGNGVFRSTVVVDGEVIGTWKRTVKRNRVVVAVEPFGRLPARRRKEIEVAADRYAAFLGLAAAEVVVA
jgi:hypothetical protein